ncbi:MAG TPA: transposase [Geminicoccaceae bacterium]
MWRTVTIGDLRGDIPFRLAERFGPGRLPPPRRAGATRLIVEEALEGEVRDALDRGYYERRDAPGQGHRNGHRTQRLKTAEGGLEYSAPQSPVSSNRSARPCVIT